MIESVNNEKVKFWAKLNEKKYQNESGLFLVEGEHLVFEAEKAGCLEETIVLKGYEDKYKGAFIVSQNVMKKISMLASIPKVIGVARKITSKGIKGNVLLLDGIQNPGNLGTIIRSAVAFNIDTIVLGEGTVSLYNPKVIRATEGLMFHINIVEKDLSSAILELKERDYKIYSTKVDGGTPLKKTTFNEKTGLVIGSEGSGVSDAISKMCDEYLYIPMNEDCESLNVGVATSIILYELNK